MGSCEKGDNRLREHFALPRRVYKVRKKVAEGVIKTREEQGEGKEWESGTRVRQGAVENCDGKAIRISTD